MSVHMLPDGRWICKWYDAEKKIKKKYFGRGPAAEVAAWEYQETLGIREYKPRTPTAFSHRFDELVQEYLKDRAGHMQRSSIDILTGKLNGIILPEIGHLEAARMTHARLDKYVQKRLQHVKRTTVHREVTDIMAITAWAARKKYLAVDPLAGFKKPRRDDEVIQPPTLDEIRRILAHAQPHLARALRIVYFTGVRPGRSELLAIPWSAVDFSSRMLFVVSAKKHGPVKRLVPITEGFLRYLETWREEDSEEVQTIVHYKGMPVASIKKSFATAKKKAKITRRLTPYSFRHAFATALLNRGADLKSTSALLGHSREDTTIRVYQHTAPEIQRAAVDLLDDI